MDHGAARKRLEKGATMLTFIWEGILSMTLAHVGPSKGLFEIVNRCVVRHQRLREREQRRHVDREPWVSTNLCGLPPADNPKASFLRPAFDLLAKHPFQIACPSERRASSTDRLLHGRT